MSSNPKDIIFNSEAREKLKKGIDEIVNVSKVTLGPKGRNVAIESLVSYPKITNDSSIIVEDLNLKDSFENMGASLAIDLARKVKEKAGDGITTSLVLLQSILQESIKNITSGINPINIKKGLEKSLDFILKEIDTSKKSITTDNEIQNVATIAASSNEEIGICIKDAIKKVGKDGIITIEENSSNITNIEIIKGFEIQRGYLSPYFCTNTDKMIAELDNPYILITDKKISSVHDLLSILQNVSPINKNLLIIADDLEPEVLSTLVINKLKGHLKVCAIKTPAFGEERREMLEDLAILTKSTFISEEKGLLLKDASINDLGSCEKIIISKENTIFINGYGDKKEIKNRVALLDTLSKSTNDEVDTKRAKKRKAQLFSNIAKIKVGAYTEAELKEKKRFFENSLNATKSALKDGIVIGGGAFLLKLSKKLDNLKLEKEEKIAKNILQKALFAPIKQIIENAGYESSSIVEEILEKKGDFGFDAIDEKIKDFMKEKIIDPANVIKEVLINSISISKIILLTETLITDLKE
ncbi:MAG: 60 kDa chaperonin [Candidatus Anoxychlamydiales bacterium]|nr:60 kDa chaperonin [Candidatus Anoxychlamydiales bacterium]